MGLFDKLTGKCALLEDVLFRMESNISNNYKDAAQANLKELAEKYETLLSEGKLNEKQKARYSDLLAAYSERMKKFTHKDQTPYWTK
ncbi:MAG: hypothetical protein J6X66_06400 [Lachnospiraceae bacterium]|nr:hypothetical protein [Lachnospiraceae bacterium]